MSVLSHRDPASHQSVFALSVFANAVRTTTGGDLGKVAYALISQALVNAAPTIGQWDIVWGPATTSQPIGKAYRMNTMYVARSAAHLERFVVAMAGTNPYSLLDWIIEDGFVHTQIPWVYGLLEAPGAKIALGTAIGLTVQQAMRPDAGLPGAGTTLIDFLRAAAKEKIEIAVAGHSLGGALSPTMALWLADTQGIPLLWDPHRNATISALPTAGPTAGNGPFAAHSGRKLGERLTPFYNAIDVVPQAWREAGTPSLSAIPTLYAPDIQPFDALSRLVGVAELLAKNGDYTPLPGLTSLPGTFNKAVQDPSKPEIVQFLAQLGYQHVPAYYGWFGFDPAWAPAEPPAAFELSPTLAATLADETASPGDLLRAFAAREARQIRVGDTLVEAPRGPGDPQTARVAALVEEELRKHGAPSAAA